MKTDQIYQQPDESIDDFMARVRREETARLGYAVVIMLLCGWLGYVVLA